MIKNKIARRNILAVLAVPVFGYILWSVAFILYATFVKIALLFLPEHFVGISPWFMPLTRILYVAFFILLSWVVFRSKLPDLAKAIYATMPLAVVFVSIGIMTYTQPLFTYGLSGLVLMVIIGYLIKTKQTWVYYYSLIFTALTLLIFTLSGGEI